MEVRGCHERLGSGVSEMKRMIVITIIAACFLGINRFVDQANAEGSIRCGQVDSSTGRLIHRIPKMIPVMALTVVWNVEYGRR